MSGNGRHAVKKTIRLRRVGADSDHCEVIPEGRIRGAALRLCGALRKAAFGAERKLMLKSAASGFAPKRSSPIDVRGLYRQIDTIRPCRQGIHRLSAERAR